MIERRKYDKEFKKNAIELLISSEKTMAELAKDLGIHPNNLWNWKKEYEKSKENAFPGNGNPHDKEIFELKKRISVLEMERDILKKAVAIFSEVKK